MRNHTGEKSVRGVCGRTFNGAYILFVSFIAYDNSYSVSASFDNDISIHDTFT